MDLQGRRGTVSIRYLGLALAAAMAWAAPARANYKSADQLKSELATFLGQDGGGKQRYAKLAWFHPTTDKGDGGDCQIYVMDSKDGTPRDLTSGSLGAHPGKLFNPNITPDGNRVIFDDQSGNIYVINWDGSGFRKALTGYYLSRTWRNPADNSDWAIVTSTAQSNRGSIGFKAMYRVNIDDVNQKVLIWDKTEFDSGQWGFWASLSTDGTRIAADFPWYWLGWASADNTGDVHWQGGDGTRDHAYQGCWMSMSKAGTYNILSTENDHHAVRRWHADNGNTEDFFTPGAFNHTVLNPNGGTFDYLRWSNDEDIITSSQEETIGGKDVRTGPVIQSLKDVYKYVNLQDSLTSFTAGNCDMLIYSDGTSISAAPKVVNPGTVNLDINKAADIIISVSGIPAPTLAATGLPAGLALQAGTTPANSFHIKGTPTAAGSSTVTVTATNSQGSDQKSFSIVVGAANQAPTVNAGDDFTVRINRPITLAGTASDDGKPSPLVTAWKQASGPGASAFANAASQNTNVTVTKSGVYKYELSAYDGALRSYDTVQVTVQDSVPFKVLHPAAGEQVAIGGTFNIQWQLDPADGVNIYLSTDGGKTYGVTSITGSTAVPDGQTSYAWRVPDTLKASANCRLKVQLYFLKDISAQSEVFSLTKGTGLRPEAARGLAWTLAPGDAGLRLQVAPGSGYRSLRLLSGDGHEALRRSWSPDRGFTETLALPPGLYLYELEGASRARGLLPVLR